MSSTALPRANIARYASALREGGSLPALVETDGGAMMVAKWRGAGQGVAALVAEIIAGELARAAGFNMPALAILELDPAIGKNERDEEIRDLLVASDGANLGMRFLEGALAFDPAAHVALAPGTAAKLVLFDSIVMNVDRTAATRTCCGGTKTSGSSTTGRRCTGTMDGTVPSSVRHERFQW